MNLTVTPLIRIAALVGLIAIVALGGSMMMLGRSHPSVATQSSSGRHGTAPASARIVHAPAKKHAAEPKFAKPTTKTVTPATHAKKTAPVTHKAVTPDKAVTTPATPATHKTVATPVQHTTATTHKASTTAKHTSTTTTTHKAATHKPAKFHGNPVYAALPLPLQWELAHHKVVVVSFYNPNDSVDAISVAEAHAGAVSAGAGFLLVNVLNDKVAGILTALLPNGGLLPQPGVLIYRAPGNIAMRLDGFADRDSISQAATDALSASEATLQSGAPSSTATAVPTAAPATPAVTPTP
jgi:hypothetical protein